MIISLIFIAWVTILDIKDPLLITGACLTFVIGQIIPSNMLYPLCLNYLPQAKRRLSAIIQGSRLIFAAIGLQLAGYFYQGSFQNIGIIIIGFIFIAILTLFFVIRNHELMNALDA